MAGMEKTMMKNKMTDLNDHLFAEMERLGDEDLKGEDLAKEISRAKAISDVASRIIDNAKLALDATKLQVEYGGINRKAIEMPPMLESKKKDA